jgi:hypothetical protein
MQSCIQQSKFVLFQQTSSARESRQPASLGSPEQLRLIVWAPLLLVPPSDRSPPTLRPGTVWTRASLSGSADIRVHTPQGERGTPPALCCVALLLGPVQRLSTNGGSNISVVHKRTFDGAPKVLLLLLGPGELKIPCLKLKVLLINIHRPHISATWTIAALRREQTRWGFSLQGSRRDATPPRRSYLAQ